jgi:hypothetical protein
VVPVHELRRHAGYLRKLGLAQADRAVSLQHGLIGAQRPLRHQAGGDADLTHERADGEGHERAHHPDGVLAAETGIAQRGQRALNGQQLGRRCGRAAHHDHRAPRIGPAHLPERVRLAPQLILPAGTGIEGEVDAGHDVLGHAVEQRRLAGNVVVERHDPGAELRSYPAHRKRSDALALDELHGGGDDPLTAQLHAVNVPPARHQSSPECSCRRPRHGRPARAITGSPLPPGKRQRRQRAASCRGFAAQCLSPGLKAAHQRARNGIERI